MNNSIMTYKGYTARIEFDADDEIFVGRLLGVRDIISFHATAVAKLRREFEAAVNGYLKYCDAHGVAPEKPASGKMMLRVPPEVHAAANVAAQAAGKSLNQWASDAIKHAAHA
jgi:predicted HicB family RNase H-like nuclease